MPCRGTPKYPGQPHRVGVSLGSARRDAHALGDLLCTCPFRATEKHTPLRDGEASVVDHRLGISRDVHAGRDLDSRRFDLPKHA